MININDETVLLKDIGEKEFIKILLNTLTSPSDIVGGRGNDATVLDIGLKDHYLLVNVDRCPTPLAFQIDPENFEAWGDLAITCVTSDLLATGAKPVGFLMALLLPNDCLVKNVLRLMKRAETLANDFDAIIIAGDTKEALQMNVITTGIGICAKNRVIHRRGARVGDLLVLTGQVGNFTAAHLSWKLDDMSTILDSTLMEPVLNPRPAYKSSTMLLSELQPTAGMDLSDGLLSTVFALSEKNQLGVTLEESLIPIPQLVMNVAHNYSISPLRLAFGTGDWQIAYAVDRQQWENLSPDSNVRKYIYPIGEFTADLGVRLHCTNGEFRNLQLIEQQHFVDSWADRSFLDYLLKSPIFTDGI